MSGQQDAGFHNDIARFLSRPDEAGAEARPRDLWDSLWRIARPEDADALYHEFRRIGFDAPAWRSLDVQRRNETSLLERMRDGLVEVLTDLHFSDEAAPQTDSRAAGMEVLHGLVATFQRAGESPDTARVRAVMVLQDLVRHPERYEAVREQAGLKVGQDSGEEGGSNASSSDFPTIPLCAVEVESGPDDVPPLVPDELYLELEEDAGIFPARVVSSEKPSISPVAERTEPAPLRRPSEDLHEEDSWLHRNLRFKNEP